MAATTTTELIETADDYRTGNVSIVRFDKKPKRKRTCNVGFANFPSGILLAILSSFSFSIAYFLVKIVESADPILFVIYRGYFQLFAFLAVAVYKGLSIKDVLRDRKTVLCLCLTGAFGAAQQITSFYAIKYIPIADGTAVLLSAPVFVSIFARVLLKENCGIFQVIAVLLALVGVLLVCRPTFLFGNDSPSTSHEYNNQILGFGLIFAGCILMAAMYISLRKASDVPFPITNATMAVFSISVALCYCLISGKDFQQPKCGWDSTFVAANAVFGTLGMLLFVLATQVEHAGPVSVARTSEIVFAFVWQISILGQIPSWTSLLGATIVVSAVAIIGFQKWSASRQGGENPSQTCLDYYRAICHRKRSRKHEISHELREIEE